MKDRSGEWSDISRLKSQAIAESERIQSDILRHLERRQPLPMRLLRDADHFAGVLAEIKLHEERILMEKMAGQVPV
ncbi:MAG TPA: hypothetical protein VKT70_01355 [Stellaceae bacterium]|nr:hypothetical protein [Stellaceae bacterium]